MGINSMCLISIAQDAAMWVKSSGNLWGITFGDYYTVKHADSLQRGAGNVQYKPYSTTSTLVAAIPSTTQNFPNTFSANTPFSLATTKTNLLSSGLNNSTGSNAFQIRRFYLGYDYNFAPKFTACMVLADEQDLDGSGNNSVYLKYAYVKWTLHPLCNMIIGQQPTPSWSTSPYGTSRLWGYRSVERTIMDMHNNDASTDLCFAIQGDLKLISHDSLKPNIVGYMVQVGNDNGAKPASSPDKILRVTFYTNFFQQKVIVGFYGDYRDVFVISTPAAPVPSQCVKTVKAYANFKSDYFRIGAEIFSQDWINGAQYISSVYAKGAYNSVFMSGWSVFLSGRIINRYLNYFARMDKFSPDNQYAKNTEGTSVVYTSIPSIINPTNASNTVNTFGNNKIPVPIAQAAAFSTQTFYTIGLDYTPTKRFHIMPNIWYDQFNSLVSVPSAPKANKDYTFVPRITFSYIFNSSKRVDDNGCDD